VWQADSVRPEWIDLSRRHGSRKIAQALPHVNSILSSYSSAFELKGARSNQSQIYDGSGEHKPQIALYIAFVTLFQRRPGHNQLLFQPLLTLLLPRHPS